MRVMGCKRSVSDVLHFAPAIIIMVLVMTVIILCMRCFHAREQEEIKHHRHPSIQPRRTSARGGSLLFLYPTSLCAAHCPTPPLFCSTVNYLVFIRGRFLNVQFLTRNAMRRCTAWDRERFVAMDYKKWRGIVGGPHYAMQRHEGTLE